MASPRAPLTAPLAALLILACESGGPAPAPSLAAASQHGGAVIVRWEGNTPETGLFILDPAHGLVAALATDDSKFGCQSGTTVGGSGNQLVESPAGPTTYLSVVEEVFVTVYDWDGSSGLSCAYLTGPAALAAGVVHGVYRDNDVFGAGGRTGTFGMGVQGELRATADDSPVRVNAHFRTLIGANGVQETVSQVLISPDPRD